MKLSPANCADFCRNPNIDTKVGLLLMGRDQTRLTWLQKQLLAKVVQSPQPPLIHRLHPDQVTNKSQDTLMTLIKSPSLFGERALVIIENATDRLTKLCKPLVEHWQQGDGFLLLIGPDLTTKSSLLALFEKDRNAYAARIYDEPLTASEVNQYFKENGFTHVSQEALAYLTEKAKQVPLQSLRHFQDKLMLLYYNNKTHSITVEDCIECDDLGIEANLFSFVDAVTIGRFQHAFDLLLTLKAQGTAATTLVIILNQRFVQMHQCLSQAHSTQDALRLWLPPLFGQARQKMATAFRLWSLVHLQQSIESLYEADVNLRSDTVIDGFVWLQRILSKMTLMVGETL